MNTDVTKRDTSKESINPVARHLAHAVGLHRRWCRDNGVAVPPELLQLVNVVNGGQTTTTSPDCLAPGDDAGVPLAYPYDEAGRLYGCSARTISRLVVAGKIRSITVGGVPRIPRSELERFITDQLQAAKGPASPNP